MEEQRIEIESLIADIEAARKKLDIEGKKTRLKTLEQQVNDPAFWTDNSDAQDIMKDYSGQLEKVRPWEELLSSATEIRDLVATNDSDLIDEVGKELQELQSKYQKLKQDLRYNGQYDDYDAILELMAGAGGTDAQDWAEMLLRMYSRWAERAGYRVALISQSMGEEAGIKSATLEISGPFAYGKLSGESGVHRLVRLSPFNSDNLRQTSFAKVSVMPKIDKPGDIDIDPKTLKVDVFRSGGKGGQSVNTTDSAVRITHLPTGITVSIQNERSQLQNKETAMAILRSRLAVMSMEQHQDQLDKLKGPNQSAEWGNQIRNYVLHPYKLVKDLRTKQETANVDDVLDGKLDDFIEASVEMRIA